MSPTQPIGWVSWHAAIRICSFYGRSGYDRRLDHKSRMKRELPVRIREGLGVQFPRATRLVFSTASAVFSRPAAEALIRSVYAALRQHRLRPRTTKTVVSPPGA